MRKLTVLGLVMLLAGCATQDAATGGRGDVQATATVSRAGRAGDDARALPGGARPGASAESPSDRGVVYSGGDGSSFDDAVIIEAPGELVGVRAEYEWLRAHGVRCSELAQALVAHDGRWFDVITCTTPQGKTRRFYFDITDFLGKM